jgi:hypothetical protein
LKSRAGQRQREEESRRDKIREESEERRCRCAKRFNFAKHCVVPIICGSRGSKK